LARRKQILLIGFGKDHCTDTAYDAAYRVGVEVAKLGAILITGGLGASWKQLAGELRTEEALLLA
jgi:predicted Rossmann-fold nucleotide-binding protein